MKKTERVKGPTNMTMRTMAKMLNNMADQYGDGPFAMLNEKGIGEFAIVMMPLQEPETGKIVNGWVIMTQMEANKLADHTDQHVERLESMT